MEIWLEQNPMMRQLIQAIVGLVKNSLNRIVGNVSLSRRELEEVLLNIVSVLNSGPWSYIEDGIEFPILTPNLLVNFYHYQMKTQRQKRKRFKYIQKCKEVAWARWKKEYIKALIERHNMKTKDLMSLKKVEKVVIVYSTIATKGSGNWISSRTFFQDLLVQCEQFELKQASRIWNTLYNIYICLNLLVTLKHY